MPLATPAQHPPKHTFCNRLQAYPTSSSGFSVRSIASIFDSAYQALFPGWTVDQIMSTGAAIDKYMSSCPAAQASGYPCVTTPSGCNPGYAVAYAACFPKGAEGVHEGVHVQCRSQPEIIHLSELTPPRTPHTPHTNLHFHPTCSFTQTGTKNGLPICTSAGEAAPGLFQSCAALMLVRASLWWWWGGAFHAHGATVRCVACPGESGISSVSLLMPPPTPHPLPLPHWPGRYLQWSLPS